MPIFMPTPSQADPLSSVANSMQFAQYQRRKEEEEREKERQEQKQRAMIAAAAVGGFFLGPALGATAGMIGQTGSTLVNGVATATGGIGSIGGAAAGVNLLSAFGGGGQHGPAVGQALGGIANQIEVAEQRQRDIAAYGRPMTPEGRLRVDLMTAQMGGSRKDMQKRGITNKIDYAGVLADEQRLKGLELQQDEIDIRERLATVQEGRLTMAEKGAAAEASKEEKALQNELLKKQRQRYENAQKDYGFDGMVLGEAGFHELHSTHTPAEMDRILRGKGEEARLLRQQAVIQDIGTRSRANYQAGLENMLHGYQLMGQLGSGGLNAVNKINRQQIGYDAARQAGDLDDQAYAALTDRNSLRLGQAVQAGTVYSPAPPQDPSVAEMYTTAVNAAAGAVQTVDVGENHQMVFTPEMGKDGIVIPNATLVEKVPEKFRPDLDNPEHQVRALGQREIMRQYGELVAAHMLDEDLASEPNFDTRRRIAEERAKGAMKARGHTLSELQGGSPPPMDAAPTPQVLLQQATDIYQSQISVYSLRDIERFNGEETLVFEAQLQGFMDLMKQIPPGPERSALLEQATSAFATLELRKQELGQ